MTIQPAGDPPVPDPLARWWKDGRVRQQLEDIIDNSDLAKEIVTRGKNLFINDRVLQAAGEAVAARIGEAQNNLPDEFKADFPNVPWRRIRSMRNRIAHDDKTLDPEILWTTLTVALPAVTSEIGLDNIR